MTLTTVEWQLEITTMTAPPGIRLCGEADIATLPSLELALEILVIRAADATVDLCELTFADVAGLRALARAAVQLDSAGRCLRLRGVSTQIQHILGVLGWTVLFEYLC
jgi:anti-anti-sigma factor